jgi:transcriptional regulator with XRE-family HTH domain
MKRNMTNKENFLALVSKEETKTVEKAKERLARKDYARVSKKIAFTILSRLDELGWKQTHLAIKMGVTPQQINKWVKGNENFTIDTLTQLGDALGIEFISYQSSENKSSTPKVLRTNREDYEVPAEIKTMNPTITLKLVTDYQNEYSIAN